MLEMYPWFFDLVVWIIPILTAVSWREATKAWASHFRGDSTAKMLGYGSFNLLKNLHPFGSIVGPLILAVRHNFVYAWARPVDIRTNFLNYGKWDTAIVALSAILSNLAMATFWAYIAYGAKWITFNIEVRNIVFNMGKAGVHINLLLFLVHLVPLAPMDMSLIVREFLLRYIRSIYTLTDEAGHYIIFALILADQGKYYVSHLMLPLYQWLYGIIHLPIGL